MRLFFKSWTLTQTGALYAFCCLVLVVLTSLYYWAAALHLFICLFQASRIIGDGYGRDGLGQMARAIEFSNCYRITLHVHVPFTA